MPPPPTGSSPHSPTNPSASPSTDNNDNEPSSSRMSRDSEGYPSWLPKRPPPPAPASTFQSSMMGLHDSSPSPVETPFVGGRKPTPRSVRIVNLQDEFAGAAENDGTFTREPTDQTRVGVNAPPRVWTRASGVPPTAFNTSEQDGFLPLPQPRFNAKNLHLQILRNPSPWMKLYFYFWPLLVFYHVPLQTFFDFNAVYTLLQVAKNPNPGSSGKNWALGAAAYIACWFAWIFVVFLTYELVYSFARRWRLRRPLMLPIYLSSPAFSMAAMTSYTNFSFLQHLRYSAFIPDAADAIAPQSASDPDQDVDESYEGSSLKQGLAETCFLYSQNTPTVALLLPRAGLSLALLLAYWTVQPLFVNSGTTNKRDRTFFREDGTLTNYARGVLIANAAWAAWRILVLIVSWLGLWLFSNQRLGGLCGPRHTWDEYEQEKTRSAFSEAATERGALRGGYQHNGEGDSTYGGDELAWEWRENTRMRVQDAFEFCLNRRKNRSDSLRWSAASPGPGPAHGYSYGYRSRRNKAAQHHRRKSSKGKEPSNEKPEERRDEPFEGIEKVLAAVGFPATASPAKRGVLSKDLFSGPLSSSPTAEQFPIMDQPGPSSGMFVTPETPKMAKRNSKDRIPGSSTAGAPLLSLPYPFSKPGSGQVSSKDLVPFPGASQEKVVAGSKNSKASKSKSSSHTSEEDSSSASGTGTGSGSGSGSAEEEEEEAEEDQDEEDDDDDLDLDEEDEDDDDFASEDPSSGRGSESMSSLGHPISPGRYPFGMRRPGGPGHRRNVSGVSSGMSSGPVVSSGSHGHSQSMSSSYGVGGVSVLTQSTGNRPSVDSERPRASLSQDSNASPSMPMPRRHPHPQTRNRQSYSSSGSSGAAAAALATLNMFPQPVAFPTTQPRRRADSGTGVPVDPELLYGEGIGSDIENQHEFHGDEEEEEDDEDEHGEREDRLGLLVPSPRASIIGGSRVSLTNSSSSQNDSRSQTHSHHSSRSRHSSARARTHSSHGSASVRERASSLGSSVKSLVTGARASLTQLDMIMRGATGPAAGLGGGGSRPRSRVNSSMARLEEDPVAEMIERGRGASGQSSGSSGSQGDVVVPHPLVGRGRRVAEVEAEGYSSGGTHSRSGSESMNTENYTFGRPVAFMRPNPEGQQQEPVEEENDDEIVLMQRSPRNSAQNSSRESPRQSGVPMVMRTEDNDQGAPQSVSSASFYSPQISERTASPRRSRRSSAAANTPERSPERRGVDIPGRQRLLSPQWAASSRAQGGEPTNVSDSPPDISTAAGSFVTAAPTFDGTATTTDSSGRRTVASSWDQNAPAIGMRLGDMGGMVERPGEDMGAGAAAWRVR